MEEIETKLSIKEPKYTFRFFQSKYDVQMGFTIFDLPNNFQTFYRSYLTSNCELCNERANKKDFAVCLTCGMLLCTHACEGKENTRGKKFLKKILIFSKENPEICVCIIFKSMEETEHI